MCNSGDRDQTAEFSLFPALPSDTLNCLIFEWCNVHFPAVQADALFPDWDSGYFYFWAKKFCNSRIAYNYLYMCTQA